MHLCWKFDPNHVILDKLHLLQVPGMLIFNLVFEMVRLDLQDRERQQYTFGGICHYSVELVSMCGKGVKLTEWTGQEQKKKLLAALPSKLCQLRTVVWLWTYNEHVLLVVYIGF